METIEKFESYHVRRSRYSSACQRDDVAPALAVLCRHLRVYSRSEKHFDEFDRHPARGRRRARICIKAMKPPFICSKAE